MWRSFRFFDFLEIFDELNINSPWLLKIDIFRKDVRELFKINTPFWAIMTFWTFFIFEMALTTMLYHKVDFDESINTQIFLFVHSFTLVIFVFSAPFCILWYLEAKACYSLTDMFYTSVLIHMPVYIRLTRKKDIIDDCIDIETEADLWY